MAEAEGASENDDVSFLRTVIEKNCESKAFHRCELHFFGLIVVDDGTAVSSFGIL